MNKNSAYKVLFLASLLLSLAADAQSYIFCIEGGGTKTILQVLSSEGQMVELRKDQTVSDQIIESGSNINVIGINGVSHVLDDLFTNTKIAENNSPLIDHFGESFLIAGMCGVTPPENRQAVTNVFADRGFNRERIQVLADAEIALELVGNEGIILISGTGSVCFGKKDQDRFRVGGLGKVLGDEGSGYHIGLEAIKAALAETYGWGEPTSLTTNLKEFFHVQDLKSLIPRIGLGEISQSKIASCAPLVFELANGNDSQAQEIIQDTAGQLGQLLSKMVKISNLSDCEVHLYGGIFKNVDSSQFIESMKNQMPGGAKNLKFVNKARDNPAVLYALKYKIDKPV